MQISTDLGIFRTERSFRKDGDFAVRLPTNRVERLVDKVRGVVDLSPAMESFQKRGFSTYYDDALNKLDVRFYRLRSDLRNDTLICFTHLDEIGYTKLLEIAFELGIEFNQTPKYTH